MGKPIVKPIDLLGSICCYLQWRWKRDILLTTQKIRLLVVRGPWSQREDSRDEKFLISLSRTKVEAHPTWIQSLSLRATASTAVNKKFWNEISHPSTAGLRDSQSKIVGKNLRSSLDSIKLLANPLFNSNVQDVCKHSFLRNTLDSSSASSVARTNNFLDYYA